VPESVMPKYGWLARNRSRSTIWRSIWPRSGTSACPIPTR
jgi:cbb3-type cytochrome oxidase cytochrome c subunit